jgi:hypothetical protein
MCNNTIEENDEILKNSGGRTLIHNACNFPKSFLTTHGHIYLVLFPECVFIEMIIISEISEEGHVVACVYEDNQNGP